MAEDNPILALCGTWEIVSFSAQLPDGQILEPFGQNPVGRITYTVDGNVTTLLMHQQRNEADGHTSSREVQSSFTAYFGTYTVDVSQQIITHNVIASLSANRASGELKRHYSVQGDTLILSFAREQSGQLVTNRLLWKRVAYIAR